MRKIQWILVAVLALALPAATQGTGKGQGKPPGKPATAEKGEQAKGKEKAAEKTPEKAEETKGKGKSKKEMEQEQERKRQAAQGRAFGKEQEKTVREWFGNKKNLEGLPPGLAKREELPPGLQRHLERNGTLPPGLQKRLQPLPENLEAKLPKSPEGVKRGIVNGNVVVIEERTSKILDIVKDVTGVERSEKRSSTGVRRTRE